MRIFLDPFMAMLGADELCQVVAFYHDQMLRIAVYNLQIWSAARECESIMDQYETQDWTGYATYPWEQLGQFDDGEDPSILKESYEWQQTEPHYGKVEMADDGTMPFHRDREFHGYLGQGGKRQCHGLPQDVSGGHTAYEGGREGIGTTAPKFAGQFDEFVTLDGRWCVQFAKGASLVKRAAIVVPVRLKRPESPTGGTGDNELIYKFSSNGAPQYSRALGIQDMHAYFFNYAGLHPFYDHAED